MVRPHCIGVVVVLGVSHVSFPFAADTRITYSGYLVDDYCHALVRSGNLALDGSNVLTDPSKHTLHCLRDIPQCRQAFYVAERREVPGERRYDVKFKLDEQSQGRARDLLDRSQLDDHGAYPVTVSGLHDGSGRLTNATFAECTERCDEAHCLEIGIGGLPMSVGGEACITPHHLEIDRIKPGILLWLHAFCMLLSWGLMLPIGVLSARYGRVALVKWNGNTNSASGSGEPQPMMLWGKPLWFRMHLICQVGGVTLSTFGVIAIIAWKRARHFKMGHEIIGIVVVSLGIFQLINSQIRFHSKVGHIPASKENAQPYRRLWELVHKNTGRTTALLGVFNVGYGVWHAEHIGFDSDFVLMALGVAIGFLGIILLALFISFWRMTLQKPGGV